MVILNPPSTALDSDLCVKTLTKVLYVAAEAVLSISCNTSNRGFPIWNEKIAEAV